MKTYPNNYKLLVARVYKVLQSIITRNSTFLPGFYGLRDDIIDFFSRPNLFDHRWGGKPGQQDGSRSGSGIESIIQCLESGYEGRVVGNFSAG